MVGKQHKEYFMNMVNANLILTANKDKALRKVTEYIELIPYYRELNRIKKFTTDSLENLLNSLPIMQKTDLQELGDALYQLPSSMISLMSETSGTSNHTPLLTPRSSEEMRWNSRNQAFAYSQHLTIGIDRLAILHPTIMSPFAEASALALQSLGIAYLRVFPIPNICDYEKIIRILSDYNITAIMTTPTLAAKLLYEKNKFYRTKNWSVNKLLLTGEYISKAMRDNFDKILNCQNATRLFVYGSSESATCMYGTELGSYYGFMNDFIYEIYTKSRIRNLTYGDTVEGNLVITWLNNGIRPLIRYDTQDIMRVKISDSSGQCEFFPLGRTRCQLFTHSELMNLDSIIFNSLHTVYHYDLQIINDDIIVNLITIEDEGKVKNAEISRMSRLFESLMSFDKRKKFHLKFNPLNHKFFDFSTRTKSNRLL